MTPARPRVDRTIMDATEPRRLSRKEWALVALGLAAWLAIVAGGLWFVRQVTRPQQACAGPADAPTRQVQGAATAPLDAFQVITGQGRCK